MVKQYVGARYVPKFASPVEWAGNTSYEALTIVTFNNASYTSKVPVPPTVGNPANNPQYWALTGNYNAQVEQYRQETETVSNNLTTEITNRKTADTTLQGQIATVSNNLTTEITNRKNADTTLQGNINSEVATRASADSNLQSQINQIVAPSGEAPSAAEVQNARIGADGVTYDTLGTAIRTQVNNLNGDIESQRNKIGGLLLTDFSKGTIDRGKYLNNESLWNIATPKYISFPYPVTVYAKDGYKLKFIFKQSTGPYTDEFGNRCRDSGWLSSPTEISANDSVRYCVRKDPLVQSGEANISELFSAIIISNRIDKIENDITDVSKSLYLTPEMFGAVGNNSADDSDAFINAITECLKSGKALFLNGKTYKINKQLNIPMSSDGKQKPLKIVGSGAYFDGQSLGLNGGTILNMLCDTDVEPGGKITTLGTGLLDISGVTFTDENGTSAPFIYTTYTTLHIHDCSFVGTKNGIKCNQDAIILGGTTENETHEQSGVNHGFQGYGTIIRDNYFNHIRRAVYGRVFANGVIVQNNCIWNDSGTNLTDGACIEFDECAENATQYNSGGLIIGNLIEVGSYYYPIKLGNCGFFSIIANNLYDAGAKDKVAIDGCWFTNKAHHNILIPGFSSRGYGTMGVYKDNGESNMVISTQAGCVMLGQRLWAESLTVETPDKTKRYKIMVDNDGNVISEKTDY